MQEKDREKKREFFVRENKQKFDNKNGKCEHYS